MPPQTGISRPLCENRAVVHGTGDPDPGCTAHVSGNPVLAFFLAML